MNFLIHFIVIPWLCALLTATTAAPLGALISWRRLVYFGETLAHASLLGIALALLMGFPIYLGIWLMSVLMVVLLFILKQQSNADSNNILGTLAHIFLALGMITLTSMPHIRTDLVGYLFGDILSTTISDLKIIGFASFFLAVVLKKIWQPLILLTVNESIAKAESRYMVYYDFIFLLIIGLYLGLMVHYLGLMLIIAFLIIPVHIAAPMSQTPEECVLIALFIAAIATTVGFGIAYYGNLPVAPTIVVSLGGIYFVQSVRNVLFKKKF